MAEEFDLLLTQREELTSQVTKFVLRSPTGAVLPGYTSGAHLTLTTPSGEKRSYSLIETGQENPTEYIVCVRREDEGRGGSLSLHSKAKIGDRVTTTGPRNTFGLEPAKRYLLIAGGIGITPIRSIAGELRRRGDAEVTVIYLSRTREETVFVEELEQSGALIHYSGGGDHQKTRRFDLWPYLSTPDDDARIYCCGPKSLIDDVLALTMHWRPSRIHIEDFAGVDALGGKQVPFQAIWEPTGQRVEVPAGRSMLQALRDQGIRTDSSCESGTCGTCRLRLMAGDVEHRDLVLTAEERSQNIMPCVSRSLGDELIVGPL